MSTTSISARVASPLLASIFIRSGLDAALHPEGKVKKAEKVTRPIVQRVTALPDDTETLVRLNGATQVVAGTMLSLGILRRLSAAVLIGSLIPTTLAGHRFWEELDEDARNQQITQLLKNLGLFGGLVLVASECRHEAPRAGRVAVPTLPVRVRPERRVSVVDPTRELVRRPRFRRALATGLGAVLTLVVATSVVPRHARTLTGRLVLDLPAILFLLLVVACARSTASELDDLARWRGGQTAGAAMRMLVTGFGYLVALIGALSILSVPVGRLLLGGAIAGVIVGIAAQQSLGNVFAGLVLLMARPFAVGNYIRVRSGALGGEFYGTVTSMSLTYVSVLTEQGLLKVPNSSFLDAAVGPWPRPERRERTEKLVTVGAGRVVDEESAHNS